MDVLILGNGISRLAYDARIRSYEGEVWACNYAFREYGSKVSRLTGHTDVLGEAEAWKSKTGDQFEIWSGHLGRVLPGWRPFTVGPKWHRDSGTTLVAQALHEGLTVELCGFDLGGADVYAHNQYEVDKTGWVRRWVEIAREWGLGRISWWGHNHTPYLMACLRNPALVTRYAKEYKTRRPHLPDPVYQQTFSEVLMVEPKTAYRKIHVRWIANEREVLMVEGVANILAARGEVEILDSPEPARMQLDGFAGLDALPPGTPQATDADISRVAASPEAAEQIREHVKKARSGRRRR